LTIGFVLYFFGFMTVGAEWFLMWQSHQWNGQQAAFRVIVCTALVLLFVCQPTPEES
jgi:predicted small integral membrane protein